jgi:Global regulator protein family
VLVLSRKAKETILIGGDIRLTVIAIRESVTRLGIEAPGDVVNLRGRARPIWVPVRFPGSPPAPGLHRPVTKSDQF